MPSYASFWARSDRSLHRQALDCVGTISHVSTQVFPSAFIPELRLLPNLIAHAPIQTIDFEDL